MTNHNLELIKQKIQKNQQEARFRVLLKRIGSIYKYTPEDNKEVYEQFLMNRAGVVKALEDQVAAAEFLHRDDIKKEWWL